MIGACPKCGARYRIDVARLPAEGARLRCSRCSAVFRVRPPAGDPAQGADAERAGAPAPAAERPPTARMPEGSDARADVRPPPAQAGITAPRGPAADGALVVIADPDVEAGKAIAGTLAEWGLRPLLVHDGVEAMLSIQRALPRAVVLDAALPKMFGFQVCEIVKRNESLRHVHVVLIGAVHHHERYRRAPNDLYGADAYVERPQLPEALRTIFRGFGLLGDPGPGAAEPRPPHRQPPEPLHREESEPARPRTREAPHREALEPPIRETPQPMRRLPAAEPPAASPLADEVTKAERLARIIVSDIVLYNQDRFDAAVTSGNVVEAMDAEMEEGRSLFQQRIDERVRQTRDFLREELLRVARLRGMR